MTDYDKALRHALLMIGHETVIPRERLADIAKLAIQTVTALTPGAIVDQELLLRELEGLVSWTVGREFIMDADEDHVPWLPGRRAKVDWKFWKRYERYLAEKDKPLPPRVIQRIDELTDKVLERLEDPERKGPWDRRGMMVGHVQSGKTSNFIGLICKAADSGYRLIVVLAGLNENLRSQTQMRVDEGFLGYSAAQATAFDEGNKPVGVGLLRTGYRVPANSLTGYEEDFKRQKARGLNISPFGHDPTILVVKKNKTILTNLISWLAGYAENAPDNPKRKRPLPDVPLLVIDDEADSASISTQQIPVDPMTGKPQEDYEVTAINGKIRQLLSLFSKKAYVGYTATPFANIFIHPEDHSVLGTVGRPPREIEIPYGMGLFPRSFIFDLPVPSNYVGPVTIFGIDPDEEAGVRERIEPLPLVLQVDDNEPHIPQRHKSDFIPASLPPSMKRAIKCFLLSCAARAQRGNANEHNSMLIHVTRFISVQKHLHELITHELQDVRNRLRYGDGASSKIIEKEFQQLWEDEYGPTTTKVMERVKDGLIQTAPWREVWPLLIEAAQKTTVKRISGGSEDVLDYQRYPEGVNVIAIGGDKLSRGLTLEGLSISYFLRPSRMYDTLMQMGRWFGYRPGYLDLCRLFTTPELIDWYKHITLSAEELRREFQIMSDKQLNPESYGLKVRSHPNGLLVTSLVKMREAQTLRVSYDGRICETIVFFKDREKTVTNLQSTERFLKGLPKKDGEPYVWSDIPAEAVQVFLREYTTHPHAPEVNSLLLSEYIGRKRSQEMLRKWTVVLVSSNETESRIEPIAGYPVRLTVRKNDSPEQPAKYTIGRLLSPTHEQYGLSDSQIKQALAETCEEWNSRPTDSRSPNEPSRPSGPSLRKKRDPNEGLLLIYALDSSHKKAQLPYDVPTIGFGISFPGDRLNPTEGVEYKANRIYIGKELGEEEEI